MSQIELLQKNLNDYISRSYVNKLIRGSIISASSLLSAWLFVSLLEYVFNFNSPSRTILFFTFLAFALSVIFIQIGIPLLQYLKVLKPISEKEAANTIGKSLLTVDDRLQNTLSLRDQMFKSPSLLAEASLRQRAYTLNKITFADSISFKGSLRLLRYFFLPTAVFLVLSVAFPDMVLESASRVVNYNQNFTPPAPFSFSILNDTLQVAEGSDFTVEAQTEGSQLPSQVFIDTPNGAVRMRKVSNDLFKCDFDRLTSSLSFRLSASGVESEDFLISVLPMPKLIRSTASLLYPDYIDYKDESLLNRSQIQVPMGTTIDWSFETKSTDEILVFDSETLTELTQLSPLAGFSELIDKSKKILIISRNINGLSDSTNIVVQAIADEFPTIRVVESVDSSDINMKYFSGSIADDYGFKKLDYKVDKVSEEARVNIFQAPLKISPKSTEQSFQFLFDLDSINLGPKESIEYYFEVWDNDGYNGSKSTKSRVWIYEIPSEQEIKEQNSDKANESKEAMDKQLNELDKLNKELEEFKKEILQKKNTDWQDKEKLKSMLEKQKKVMEKLMNKAQEQRKQNEFNNRFQEYSPELRDKQETIQKMFDELFTDEFKKKYDEYNKMLEKLNKDKALDQLDEMKLDNEQLEKELDRTLELFKELEFEQKLEENIKKAEELANRQEELKSKTTDKSEELKKLNEEQKKLSEEMKDLSKEMQKLEDLNNSLEDKKKLPDTDSEQQSAEEKMNDSSQEMEKNNRKKSAESQDDAQDSLEEMQKKLSAFQEEEGQEQASEDLDDMRQILENLIGLSHRQESVMQELKVTSARDPKFVVLAKNQKNIIDDSKVVEDSLLALSKRVPEIGRNINDEISLVKQSMGKALDNMTNQQPNQEKRYREMTLVNQQLSMTSLNNLAILFDAMIDQAQKAQNSKMKGTGQCKKPGNGKSGKPSISDMKQMQKGLNDQIKKLKEAMEEGRSPNGRKPGQMPGSSGGKMSKELARMAAQQEAIREQLQELSNQIESQGGNPGSSMKKLEKMMEQTEEELLYKDITQKTLDRQQDILNKLLESDKAEREREMEQKRESKSSQTTFEVPTEIWEEYQKKKLQELELYKTLPPNLKPYYRKRVNRYFSQFTYD
jgi:hypothetical protein